MGDYGENREQRGCLQRQHLWGKDGAWTTRRNSSRVIKVWLRLFGWERLVLVWPMSAHDFTRFDRNVAVFDTVSYFTQWFSIAAKVDSKLMFQCARKRMRTRSHAQAHTHAHSPTHAHARTHVRTYAHTHARTHIYKNMDTHTHLVFEICLIGAPRLNARHAPGRFWLYCIFWGDAHASKINPPVIFIACMGTEISRVLTRAINRVEIHRR